MNYMKNFSSSFFKWLVAWKRGLPRQKVSYECSSPSPTLSYFITKKKRRIFCDAKVIEASEAPEGFLRVFFMFHSDRVFLSVLSDRVFFRVLCDRIFLESLVIGSSSGSSVIESSLGLSAFFSGKPIFFIKI